MLKKKNRILAVDPGAREMGVVVLDNAELIYYGVKSLKKFPSRLRILSKALALPPKSTINKIHHMRIC